MCAALHAGAVHKNPTLSAACDALVVHTHLQHPLKHPHQHQHRWQVVRAHQLDVADAFAQYGQAAVGNPSLATKTLCFRLLAGMTALIHSLAHLHFILLFFFLAVFCYLAP
jgi:hypothetical protein